MACEVERRRRDEAQHRLEVAQDPERFPNEVDPCGPVDPGDPTSARVHAQCLAQLRRERDTAQLFLDHCEKGLRPPGFLQDQGHLDRLHVREVEDIGTPGQDFIAANVAFGFREEPFRGRIFGFALRSEAPFREAQLQLLRDAFTHDHLVVFEYNQELNNRFSIVQRIEIRK